MKLYQKLTALAVLTGASASSHAVTAYDSITGAADWGDVTTGVVAIFAAVAGVLVVFRGGRMLLGAIKR